MPNDARALAPESGAQVARLFGATIATIWVAAWWSWALQAPVLLGDQGLLPLAQSLQAHRFGLEPTTALSVFWLDPSDIAQQLVIAGGLIAAALASSGFLLRPLLTITLAAYLSFVSVGAPFAPLLGDRLLIGATLLALCLPRNRPSVFGHFVARLLVIRLYVSLGLSHIALSGTGPLSFSLAELFLRGPLPTWGGYLLHSSSPFMLSLGGKCLLFAELVVPWLFLGPRRARLLAGIILTAVQLVGVMTLNTGLFAFVAVALHLFCMGDGDVELLTRDLFRSSGMLGRAMRHLTAPRQASAFLRRGAWLRPLAALRALCFGALLAFGLTGVVPASLASFGPLRSLEALGWPRPQTTAPLAPLGREVVVLEVLPSDAGPSASRPQTSRHLWQPLELWHVPSEISRPPRLIAPHAPRLDLALSSLGKAAISKPPPPLIEALVEMICTHPERLERLVRPHAWRHAQAVRVRLYDFSLASIETHLQSGAFWERSLVSDGGMWRCDARVGAAK